VPCRRRLLAAVNTIGFRIDPVRRIAVTPSRRRELPGKNRKTETEGQQLASEGVFGCASITPE
jgi:hypothetical protein